MAGHTAHLPGGAQCGELWCVVAELDTGEALWFVEVWDEHSYVSALLWCTTPRAALSALRALHMGPRIARAPHRAGPHTQCPADRSAYAEPHAWHALQTRTRNRGFPRVHQ